MITGRRGADRSWGQGTFSDRYGRDCKGTDISPYFFIFL
jgi:hypothetical protein